MPAVTSVLKALANPNRRTIYQLICRGAPRHARGVTIEELCARSGMRQPAVSHHVAQLARTGLVSRRKIGWWVYCTPSSDGLSALLQFARNPAAFPLAHPGSGKPRPLIPRPARPSRSRGRKGWRRRDCR